MAGVIAATMPLSTLSGRRLHAARPARSVAARRLSPRHIDKRQITRTDASSVTAPASGDLSHAAPFGARTAFQVAAKAALDLKQRGWTVVDDLVSQEECFDYVNSVWHWLESLGTGISRSVNFVRCRLTLCGLRDSFACRRSAAARCLSDLLLKHFMPDVTVV